MREGKEAVKEWVASKRTDPPPPPSSDQIEPHMIGIPKVGAEILGGKYTVERVLGVGGMGVVVSARHKQLGQEVAIKFLSSTMQTPELVDRFVREGQAAVRIRSEHIATVLDVGVLENGTPYLMMEYLSGADLGQYLTERGPLPVAEAVDFVLQACAALAVAHSSGIVHRDLKPSNLFMTQRSDGSPLIKVLDFGISKISQGAGEPDPRSTLTRPGMMLGSPRYMSPEQLRNASRVDHRADIWAIGIVLHELVTGITPYEAETFTELCSMIASDPPARLRQAKPDAPEELEAIILKCLEKDPAARWQNVAELAGALAPLAPEESRVVAARVGRILGQIPGKTPPGAYGGATTGSSGTPKPTTPKPSERTLPLPTPSEPRISMSSPMASTSPANPPPGSSPSLSDARSALAISHAKQARGSGARIGGIIAALALLAGIAFTVWFLRQPRTPAEPSSEAAKAATPEPPAATSSLATAATPQPAQPPQPQPETASTAEPTTTAEAPAAAESSVAKPTTPPLATTAHAVARPRPTSRPATAASSVAPATSQSAPPAQPSEADMLNRRR